MATVKKFRMNATAFMEVGGVSTNPLVPSSTNLTATAALTKEAVSDFVNDNLDYLQKGSLTIIITRAEDEETT